MILQRIPDKLKADIELFRSSHTDLNEAYFFSAEPRMGKTYAALSYCAENKDSLYFSFQHNVHIVPLKSLFAAYNKEYNRRMHPRFVPSFV